MSSSNLSGIAPLYGFPYAPSLSFSSGGATTGEVTIPLGQYQGSFEGATGYCRLVPSYVVSYFAGASVSTDVELDDIGLFRLQVDVLDFDPASIGAFEEGLDPQRKYGSVGLWQGDSFLGWRSISRLKNRFLCNRMDESNSALFLPFQLNALVYTFLVSDSLANYGTSLLDYLRDENAAAQFTVDRLSWKVAPSVTISLTGWNACAGVYRAYSF